VPRPRKNRSAASPFGRLLRELRLEAGLTQDELAHRASVDLSFVSRMERGLTQPSIGTFLVLSKVLRITPVDLIERLVSAMQTKK
jgi:transcriptional regulator with XRE-family HTH domain